MADFEDEFTESSNVALRNHTPDVGTSWVYTGTNDDGFSISAANDYLYAGMGLVPETVGSGINTINPPLSSPDQQVWFKLKGLLTSANRGVFVGVRMVDEDNLIGIQQYGTGAAGLRLCKIVSGVVTDTLVQTQGVDEEWYRITAEGTSIKLWGGGSTEPANPETDANWTQLGSTVTVSEHSAETDCGLSNRNAVAGSNDFIDNFRAHPIGGGGASAIAGTASLSISLSGSIIGSGALSGGSTLDVAAAGVVTGDGILSGAAGLTLGANAAIDAVGVLAGAIALSVTLDGAVSDANGDALVGTAGLTLGAAGAISGIGRVDGSAAVALGAAGSLADGNSGAIVGTADFQLAATGAVTGAGSLEGTVTILLGTSAELVDVNLGADPIAGIVAMAIAAAGEITGAHAIDGSASITIGTSADLIDAGSLIEVTLVGRFFRRGTDTTWLPSSGGYRYITKVHLDQPDVDLLDDRVRSREYEMTFEAAAMPALDKGESVVIGGTTYTVREAPRLIDDGVIARTLLTKPSA